MADLLDIQVEHDRARLARRVRPHRDGRRAAALLRRTARPGGSRHRPSSRAARLHARCSRTSGADYGSTCTILTEHLRAVDVNISERTATAMLYAIKSDTLFFARQTNRVGPRSVLVPVSARRRRAHPQDGRRGNHARAARATSCARPSAGRMQRAGVLGVPRRRPARGLHPLHRRLLPAARRRQVDDRLRHRRRQAHRERAQPRLLAERRRVRQEGTSATSAAPAAIARWPRRSCRWRRFRAKFGDLSALDIGRRIGELAEQFLHEHRRAGKGKEDQVSDEC